MLWVINQPECVGSSYWVATLQWEVGELGKHLSLIESSTMGRRRIHDSVVELSYVASSFTPHGTE